MKTSDCPNYLKPLNKLFNMLESQGYRGMDIFSGFVDSYFSKLSFGTIEGDSGARIEYNKALPERFSEIHEIVDALYLGRQAFDWIDVLGDYYEASASRWYRGYAEQFYTPKTVCNTTAKMLIANRIKDKQTFLDTACGSSRLLLACGAVNPQGIFLGMELDALCAKMSAINLCKHGLIGEIVCKDALSPTDFRAGYAINRGEINGNRVNCILPITAEQSWIMRLNWSEDKTVKVTPSKSLVETENLKVDKKNQIALL